jgi:hypothetical protein
MRNPWSITKGKAMEEIVGVLVSVVVSIGTYQPMTHVYPLGMYPIEECHREAKWRNDAAKADGTHRLDHAACVPFSEATLAGVLTKFDGERHSAQMFELPLDQRVDRPVD